MGTTVINFPIGNTIITLVDGMYGVNGTIVSDLGEDEVESMILGHACAGVDIIAPSYIDGTQSALDGIGSNT